MNGRRLPSPEGPGKFLFYMFLVIGGALLSIPWIMTGMQHYFEWVFQTTGFH